MSTSHRISFMESPSTGTVDGHAIPHKQHLSGIAVAGLVLIGILFAVLAYFYFVPLFRKPVEPQAASQTVSPAPLNADTEAGGTMNQSEKTSLVAWMRRRSRGRFADTTGSNRGSSRPLNAGHRAASTTERSPGSNRNTSSLSRISIVPHLPLPPALPRAHTDRPTVRVPGLASTASPSIGRPRLHTAPPTVSSPLAPKPRRAKSKLNIVSTSHSPPRSDATPTDAGRSKSPPLHDPKTASNSRSLNATPTQSTFHLPNTSRSASDSEVQQPGGATTHLSVPSKAMVIDKTQERSNGSPILEIERSAAAISAEEQMVTPMDSTTLGEGSGEGSPKNTGTPSAPL